MLNSFISTIIVIFFFFNLNNENAELHVERSFCQLRTCAAVEPWLLMALILNILRTVTYC